MAQTDSSLTVKGQRDKLRDQTVSDFGQQWTFFTENRGYYASDDFFADLLSPLLTPDAFDQARCAEIGAGTGNISAMMLRSGASELVAVEPSDAVGPLQENLAEYGDRVELVHGLGDQLPARDFDLVLSIGVLHHIPEPAPVVDAAFRSLRPGGQLFVWLYGKEGNSAYLAFAQPVRAITRWLPIRLLNSISYVLDALLQPFVFLANRGVSVPLSGYLRDVYGKLSASDRRVVIVDQLKPAWALYYTEKQARSLLESAGFVDIQLHNRHGYSWSVLGKKPENDRVP